MPLAARVLVVIASQRRSGNTAATLDLPREEVLRRASAEGLDARWDCAALADLGIESCTGCRACFELGESHCPRRDGLLALRDRILASRIVVFAAPVYVNDICGTMKTLVDRLAFICHRPAFAGIGCCLVATAGGSPTRHAIRTLEAAVLSWGGAITARLGLKTGSPMNGEEIGRVHGEAIRRCARRLVPSLCSAACLGPRNHGFGGLPLLEGPGLARCVPDLGPPAPRRPAEDGAGTPRGGRGGAVLCPVSGVVHVLNRGMRVISPVLVYRLAGGPLRRRPRADLPRTSGPSP